MKKFLSLFSLIVIFSSLLTAQGRIDKGMYRLSGAAAFSWYHQSEDYYTYNRYQFSLSPSFSYLITKNFELGGVFNLTYFNETQDLDRNFGARKFSEDYSSIGLGPQMRYYFTTENLIPFISLSLLYSSAGQQGGTKMEITNLNLGGGMDYFFSESVALEPFITYSLFWNRGQNMSQLSIGTGINYFIR